MPRRKRELRHTENLIIEGDNLEVLKLLQKSYLGMVKMIYIDPPYNTGNDFIYPDNYSESLNTYLQYTGQVDDEGRKFGSNTEADGRFHSKWMNMMFPRLYLARNLLRDDGCIFITIDDTELDNLRKLCIEVFGEENFLASIVWQKKYAVSNDDPGIGSMHDYILMFQKTENFQRRLLPRTEKQLVRYTNLDNDPRGRWSSDNYISNKSRQERPTLWYSIIHPKTKEEVWPEENAVWRYSKDKHAEMEKENRLYWGPDQSYKRPRIKRFLTEVQDGVVPSTWWSFEDVGHDDEGQKETAELIGPKVFSTPKPVRLMTRLLELSTVDGDLVLDFFAGSGSLGHAALERTDGSRKFVLVQLPEKVDLPQFSTIADITKERIRSVIKRLEREQAEQFKKQERMLKLEDSSNDATASNGDLGFRVFKLDQSNFNAWNSSVEHDSAKVERQLDLHIDHIRDNRTPEDILYELLLKSGFPLTTPVEQQAIEGKTVYSIAGGALMICLDGNLTLGLIRAIAELKPERVVFLDEGFAGNDQLKANAVQTFKTKGVASFRTV